MFAAAGAELLILPILLLICIPIGLAMMAFWIWMLIHAIQNKGLSEGEKIAWVIVLVFVHFLGAVIYFFVGRPKAGNPLPRVAPVIT